MSTGVLGTAPQELLRPISFRSTNQPVGTQDDGWQLGSVMPRRCGLMKIDNVNRYRTAIGLVDRPMCRSAARVDTLRSSGQAHWSTPTEETKSIPEPSCRERPGVYPERSRMDRSDRPAVDLTPLPIYIAKVDKPFPTQKSEMSQPSSFHVSCDGSPRCRLNQSSVRRR